MTSGAEDDRETAKVLEVLNGATRQPNDPDVQLAKILSKLASSDDSFTLSEVLESLIRDARSN